MSHNEDNVKLLIFIFENTLIIFYSGDKCVQLRVLT